MEGYTSAIEKVTLYRSRRRLSCVEKIDMSSLDTHHEGAGSMATFYTHLLSCDKSMPVDTVIEDFDVGLIHALDKMKALEADGTLPEEGRELLNLILSTLFDDDSDLYPELREALYRLILERDALLTLLDEATAQEGNQDHSTRLKASISINLSVTSRILKRYELIHPRQRQPQDEDLSLSLVRILLNKLREGSSISPSQAAQLESSLNHYLNEASEERRRYWLFEFMMTYKMLEYSLDCLNALSLIGHTRTDEEEVSFQEISSLTTLINAARDELITGTSTPTVRERAVEDRDEPSTVTDGGGFKCPVCFDSFTSPLIELKCTHPICRGCLVSLVAISSADQCPLCRSSIDVSIFNELKEAIERAQAVENDLVKNTRAIMRHVNIIVECYISQGLPEHRLSETSRSLVHADAERLVRESIQECSLSTLNFMDRLKCGSSLFNEIIQLVRSYREV